MRLGMWLVSGKVVLTVPIAALHGRPWQLNVDAVDWEERLHRELAFLYGADAPPLARELCARARADARLPRSPGFDDPGEAILITYGDQVSAPGQCPLATLREFLGRHATGLVSGVHVLPFFPWSSDDGFSVKDFHAVDPVLGTWDDIRALGADFDLMADAVFNHASVQGDWFAKFLRGTGDFGDFFVTVTGNPDLSRVIRPRALPLLTGFPTPEGTRKVWTTFSADQADLNFHNPRVMLAVSEALLLYLRQGARYIRLDAVGFIWKEPGTTCLHLPQAHALVRAWRALTDGAAPGARIVTETNVPHADNISYFGNGRDEAQMVYNFALPPLVLHTICTGDATALTRWAAGLQTPSDGTTFFNFLASHDGIGLNPARGILSDAQIGNLVDLARTAGGFVGMKSLPDGTVAPYELNVSYFDALAAGVDEETAVRRFTAAHAIAFALAGVPGIYFHSLFGSRGDADGARSSGIPRRINREKFRRDTLESELERPGSLRRRIFENIAGLLRQRRGHRAFAPSSPQRILDAGAGIFAVERGEGADRVLCLHEIAGRSQEHEGIRLAPYEVRWS
ncbi:MAG: sugar phosphorylase [Chthoniobacterales bacterium]|nr:sugar phosphorylase [Chthoniobacterales bacterium]